MATKLLAFSGSSRSNSINRQLLAVAVKAAEDLGADVTTVDLGALALPIYNGDLEDAEGLPAGAVTFKAQLRDVSGLLIASPEYNSMVTPLLLNAISWASRPGDDAEDAPPVFAGKVAGIIAASPGPLGGLRGLTHLRGFLQNIGIVVCPTMAAVGSVRDNFFNQDGSLSDPKTGARLQAAVQELLDLSA